MNQSRNMNNNQNLNMNNNFNRNFNNSNQMNNSYSDQQIHNSAFSSVAVMPISSLSPNCMSWRIRAKVESKANIREWDKGDKHYINFSIILSDKHGGKIEGTFWGESCHKFYPMLQEDKVYEMSGGQIKPVNRQWAKCDHNFSLSFDQNAQINEVQEQIETRLNIKTIDECMEPNGTADFLVKVLSHAPMQEISTRFGLSKIKKLNVVDKSMKSVELTLWKDQAEAMEQRSNELDNNCIIAMLGASYKNHEQYGKTIGAVQTTRIIVNPIEMRNLAKDMLELEQVYATGQGSIQPTTTQFGMAEFLPIKMYEELTSDPSMLPNRNEAPRHTIVGLHN